MRDCHHPQTDSFSPRRRCMTDRAPITHPCIDSDAQRCRPRHSTVPAPPLMSMRRATPCIAPCTCASMRMHARCLGDRPLRRCGGCLSICRQAATRGDSTLHRSSAHVTSTSCYDKTYPACSHLASSSVYPKRHPPGPASSQLRQQHRQQPSHQVGAVKPVTQPQAGGWPAASR